MRVALFDLGIGQSQRLLILVHHLVADGFSFPILLEDLSTAYQQLSHGKTVRLPAKTTSLKRWIERLVEYARSAEAREELAYWLADSRSHVESLPVDYPGGSSQEAFTASVRQVLSMPETSVLVGALRNSEFQMEDVLLTALVQVLREWTGKTSFLIMPLGHGRETMFEDIDLSRTVGWLNTGASVLFELGEALQPQDLLRIVKAQLRRVPHAGLGYGALRYLVVCKLSFATN